MALLLGDLVGYFPSLYASLPESWDPMVQGGTPLLPNPQAGFFYPPAWLLRDLQAGLPFYLFLHFAIGAVATWAWVRTRLGDGWEAVLAGVVFALSGPTFSLAITPDKLPGHVMLPVILLGVHWWFEDERPRRNSTGLALVAVGLAATWLGGSVESVFIAGLAVPFWAAFLPGAPDSGRWRRLGLTVGALGLGTLLAGVLLVPFFQLLPETARAGALPIEEAMARSTHPVDWLGWIAPNPFWEGGELAYRISEESGRARWLRSHYGGLIVLMLWPTLLLARRTPDKGVHGEGALRLHVFSQVRILAVPGGKLIAAPARRLRALPGIRPAFLAVVGFAILALGDFTPLQHVVHALPGFGSIRYPDKWWLGTVPFQAWLAAMVFRAVLTDVRAARLALSVGLAVGVLAVIGFALSYGGGPIQRTLVRMSDTVLPLGIAIALFARWSGKQAGFAWLFVAVVAADLGSAAVRSVPYADGHALSERPALVAAIRADQVRPGQPRPVAPPRIWDQSLHAENRLPLPRPGETVPDMQRVVLAPNLATEYGVAYVDGMRALRLDRQAKYSAILEDLDPVARRRLLQVLGVDYWVVWDFHEARALTSLGLRPVPAAPGVPLTVGLLADDEALPLVRQEFGWLLVNDDAHAYRVIQSRQSIGLLPLVKGDPGVHALLGSEPPSPIPEGRTPDFERVSGGHWEVETKGDQSSLVVLQQAWAPGWEVKIDDEPWAPALRVEHMLVGAAVPEGNHTVVLRYRAAGLMGGVMVSLLGVILTMLALRGTARVAPSPEPVDLRRSRRRRGRSPSE